MKNYEKLEKLLENQKFARRKDLEEQKLSQEVLRSFGVNENSEFYRLYSNYFLGHLKSRDYSATMVDPCPPQSFEAANMAHKYWNIPYNYILFTTPEGDGGYLYNTENDSVWDFTLGQQSLLETNSLKHWDNFSTFFEWYLSED